MAQTTLTIESIISPALTRCGVSGSSKKRVLEYIANLIAQHFPFLDENAIFTNLVCRERLGSTGIGQGIAIPHCRLENCDRIIGALITLKDKIPFDAIDNEPVDLLFVLIVPQEATSEHLDLLSQLAQKFNDRRFCEHLRDCDNDETLFRRVLEK
ncbi:PTS IIA-like nitrogen-regulatory protein PtsN [Hahella chejuensis KCTC 2396]|uniref:PTS IIA-like nitrogen-regulatory protein PtsN n=1 Tax=Hahella chejuensis (strain KCTC 2396) TaxID=349521 RepID=Q2SBH9_HAHCH|nr:PTS IIA-like nitrogen regulatory protein PtsN [Hahella chejuensis]ABC31995.1 PTS IIA-like nitrogen-regulatory protein PtsN [Hahella chejuensis KCTC 2396]